VEPDRPSLPAAARALCQASTEAGGGSLLASVGAKVRGALTPDKAQAGAARVLDEARAQGKSLSEATSDAMASYRKARKDENFQAFNQMLLETEVFGMDVMRRQYALALEEHDKMGVTQRVGLSVDRLRGGGQSAAIDQMKEDLRRQLGIIEEMTPSERRKPTLLLGPEARQRIVEKLGLVDERPVAEMLTQYEWIRVQWEFVRREQAKGRDLPQNPKELQWMLQRRPTPSSFALMKRMAKKYDDFKKKHGPRGKRRSDARR